MRSFKYEMMKKKKLWNDRSSLLDKQYIIPIEQQPSVVKELVTPACFKRLCSLLDIPLEVVPQDPTNCSIEGDILIPSAENGLTVHLQDEDTFSTRSNKSELSIQSGESRSSESCQLSPGSRQTMSLPLLKKLESKKSSEEYEALSYFVEVDRKTPTDITMIKKHKAILRFLGFPEAEVASWRTNDSKGVEEVSEMTLEKQGDFLINKIAADFCEWMRKLGGNEKSFINEDILKELFEICMDNPASRAICVKTRERRVLFQKLAEFLQVPEKSFHEVLSSHLNWDSKVEKINSRMIAFGKALPKEMQFKTPKNKTYKTWLEWNKSSTGQVSFANIYSSIKDLRSTKEYCRWLLNHPEHKKPQFLVDQGLFEPLIQVSKSNQADHHSFKHSASTTTAVSMTSGRI